ncbi:hypothetical protein RchiOBHm_Chr1g0349001 [Rosa chinensis]|uniref:Uncharacterized protein n=1 Tax=Rosa chinensis TaxID=74649 RepID=A0A2P6SFP5_ROSCH|nr:hypothetical protein RchiOBHm_Chr1g0349001 [Rosa chinensis]
MKGRYLADQPWSALAAQNQYGHDMCPISLYLPIPKCCLSLLSLPNVITTVLWVPLFC